MMRKFRPSPNFIAGTLGLFMILGFWIFTVANLAKFSLSERHYKTIFDVAFSPDGKTVASAGTDGHIMFWDVESEVVRRLPGKATLAVLALAYSPDGKTLIAEHHDIDQGMIEIRDANTGEILGTTWPHMAQERSLRFSPDGTVWAAGGLVWDVAKDQPRFDFKGGNRVAISTDGKTLASGSHPITLWDMKTGEQKTTLGTHEGMVTGLSFSRDGKFLASVATDHFKKTERGTELVYPPPGELKVWEVTTGLLRIAIHVPREVHSVAYSPDGKSLAYGREDGDLVLLDTLTYQVRKTYQLGSGVTALTYSPDGRVLAVGTERASCVRFLRDLP